MPRRKFPTDRDVLIAMAASMVDKNAELTKRHGAGVPREEIAGMRAHLKVVRRPAVRINKLRTEADTLAEEIAPDVRKLEGVVRDEVEFLERRLKDRDKVREWGVRYAEDRGAKPKPPPAAR